MHGLYHRFGGSWGRQTCLSPALKGSPPSPPNTAEQGLPQPCPSVWPPPPQTRLCEPPPVGRRPTFLPVPQAGALSRFPPRSLTSASLYWGKPSPGRPEQVTCPARLPWKLSTFTELFMHAVQPGRPQAHGGDRQTPGQTSVWQRLLGGHKGTVTSRPPPSHLLCLR